MAFTILSSLAIHGCDGLSDDRTYDVHAPGQHGQVFRTLLLRGLSFLVSRLRKVAKRPACLANGGVIEFLGPRSLAF